MVNNIEVNVSNAAEYISRAKEETKKAVRYQKKSRRVSISLSLLGVFHRLQYFFFKCLTLVYIICLLAFGSKFTFIWQKYIIIAFALLILLAVVALIVGLSVGLTKPPL